MVKLDPQDAQLLLQIYDLRREEKLRRAREWVLGNFWAENLEDFNALCPAGSQENAYYRQATTYWETVALIVNKGMLDEDLYFESTNESLFTWIRVQKVVSEMRKQRKNPLILRNLETLSEKHEKWLTSRAPELIQEMQKMFQASRKKAKEAKK